MKHAASAVALLLFVYATPAFCYGENEADLLKNLPQSKHSLTDAIVQVEKMGEFPTAAKFEYEDGALHLAVYASGKGKKLDAEHNVLKEHKGDPKQATWKPKTEIFKDVEHISRAAEYHTLMEVSPASLREIAVKAQSNGRVLWVIPVVAGGKPVFDVGVLAAGKVQHIQYGLLDGQKR